MNRIAKVYNNKVLAGSLTKTADGFIFQYDEDYILNPDAPAISLSLPKRKEAYRSNKLFPFFFGLLSEGVNKQTQCRLLKIDENDHFTLLINTANSDTIGSVTVKPVE